MDENLHDIDDLFRKAINEHDDVPSSKVWSNLDKSLDKKKVLSISKKYQKLKWAAAALLIFTAGMAMYTWHTRMRNQELVKMNNARQRQADKNQGLKKDDKIIADNARLHPFDYKTKAVAEAENKKMVKAAVAAGHTAGKLSEADNKPLTSAEVKKETYKITTVKPFPEAVITSAEKGTVKTGLTKEVIGKNAADKAAGVVTTDSPISEAGMNKAVVHPEEKAEGKTDDLLNSPNKKVVANISTVHEPKNNFSEIPKSNAVLERSLHTLTSTNKIKPDEKVADNRINNKTKNKTVKTGKQFALSATVFYSPDFVSSKADDDQHQFREDDRNAIKSKEKINNTWTAGVMFNVNTGKKITFHTGLSFSTLTTNIQSKPIFARPDDRGNINYRFNCSAGYSFVSLKPGNGPPPAPGDSIKLLSATNTLQYLSIPLAVGYRITKGHFTMEPLAGIAANFLTKGSIETVIPGAMGNEKTGTNHIEGLNKSYFSGIISLEANYQLNKFIALSFTPAARFALTSINKDAPLKTYLNSFGLAAGLKIGL